MRDALTGVGRTVALAVADVRARRRGGWSDRPCWCLPQDNCTGWFYTGTGSFCCCFLHTIWSQPLQIANVFCVRSNPYAAAGLYRAQPLGHVACLDPSMGSMLDCYWMAMSAQFLHTASSSTLVRLEPHSICMLATVTQRKIEAQLSLTVGLRAWLLSSVSQILMAAGCCPKCKMQQIPVTQ